MPRNFSSSIFFTPAKEETCDSWHFQVATRCNLQIAVVAKRFSSGMMPFSPYSTCFNFQAFLACQNLICLAVFAISLLWPFHIFSMFVLLDSSKSSCSIHAMTDFDILWLHDTARLIFDENIYTSNHHFCCSKLQGSEKWNQFWHLGWSTMGLHQTLHAPRHQGLAILNTT